MRETAFFIKTNNNFARADAKVREGQTSSVFFEKVFQKVLTDFQVYGIIYLSEGNRG